MSQIYVDFFYSLKIHDQTRTSLTFDRRLITLLKAKIEDGIITPREAFIMIIILLSTIQEFVPTSSIYLPTWPHLSTRVSYPYNTLQLHSLFKDEILCVLLRSRIFWMANHVKVHADRWEI